MALKKIKGPTHIAKGTFVGNIIRNFNYNLKKSNNSSVNTETEPMQMMQLGMLHRKLLGLLSWDPVMLKYLHPLEYWALVNYI